MFILISVHHIQCFVLEHLVSFVLSSVHSSSVSLYTYHFALHDWLRNRRRPDADPINCTPYSGYLGACLNHLVRLPF